MSKSIYEEALKELTWLVHDEFYETPKRLILNASQRLDMFKKVRDTLEKAKKQEKVLNKIKDIINRPSDSYIISMLESSEKYIEIKNIVKELENELD